MQNRYVGDIGDYVKLAILRQLARGKRLGVAWWLVRDESHNNDGGHREYLERGEWRRFDPPLFEALVKTNERKERDVRALEDSALLPRAVFAKDRVPCEVLPFARRPAERQRWLIDVKTQFEHCDLIFFDPDNGIAPHGLSVTQRRAGKSVLIGDLKELSESPRAMVVYHHQTHRKGGHDAERHYFAARLKEGGFHVSGALRAKPWSPRLFFILDGDEELCGRARTIAKSWDGWISWHPDI